MYGIVIPGKVGNMTVRYASAADALEKFREMEEDGLSKIDVTNAKGEQVTVDDLERGVAEAEDAHAT